MRNLLKKLLATSLLVTTFNTSAAIIRQSDSFGTQGSSTDVVVAGSFLQTLQIAGFDSSLGTLTNVTISIAAQLNSTGSSKNVSNADGRAEIDLTMFTPFEVNSSATNGFVFVPASTTPFLSDESAPNGTFDLIPNTANDTFTYDLTTNQMNGSLTANSLSAFITSSNIDFDFTAFINTAFTNQVESGEGTFTNTFSTAAWGQVDVVYTYTEGSVSVPAPASLATFGLFLIALAACRRVRA